MFIDKQSQDVTFLVVVEEAGRVQCKYQDIAWNEDNEEDTWQGPAIRYKKHVRHINISTRIIKETFLFKNFPELWL